MKRKLNSLNGFTIVELIVVIAVIGILAAITVVAYNGIKTRSMDARIKVMVNDVGKVLYTERMKGNKPTANGYWTNSGGVDSFLVPAHFTAGYRGGLSSVNAPASSDHIFRYYTCSTASGINGFAIYASLNDATTQERLNFTNVRNRCGHNTSQAPDTSTGTNPIYNYAKLFS